MDSAIEKNKRNKVLDKYVIIFLLGGLVFLRFPFLIVARYNWIYIENPIEIFENSTYLLSALLIWWERKRISEFYIGIWAFLLFIFLPIIKSLFNLLISPFVDWTPTVFIIQIPVAIILFLSMMLYFKKSGTKIKFPSLKYSIKWILISIIIGIIFGYLSGSIFGDQRPNLFGQGSFLILLTMFFNHFSSAALVEEPLFRGFIWGYLKKARMKDHWILITQMLLFTLAHIYYWGQHPLIFFIAVPSISLILGLMVWRSKSISTSMTVHGLINSVAQYVEMYM